jgi:ornithine cyclodeaminase/alanine dehydrogenase-like protein (mu-crystallin family)
LMAASRVIVDDLDLAAATGALRNAGLDAADAAGTFRDILRGTIPAHDAARPSVYAPVGLPWQDLVLSWILYRRAGELGKGTVVDLLA